ncbi:MAG: DUF1622 domain-containing protein [Salinimicrobium sediminis]|uniref:Uncharacterized membrane protein n=1 Tax=Salinimicrobium sediminis TaxID=1343891 RepID=A0A285X595_9FLAO|nr:DUF1622 domain-containing protein [Salinimicrobium sediminis]MDX1602698.1 DUF1622 domain-containing protein [Salinimicrobium sediminis]MDX1753996.1 DUF1622 domain-containing protein [Salinimicrobium sediminis]SOC80517.1 Uncharacterized membrane protein [Salinimicrobium sediminis]
MHETVQFYVEWAALVIEVAGVLVMVIGPFFALWRYFFNQHEDGSTYRTFRHDLGKAILLGLEFLVAGDIIATVSTAPTMDNVLVLAVIVVIRTFLSLSLQVELEGKWPWQKKEIGN